MSSSSCWLQLSAFGSCNGGAIALVFGLSLVPVILAAGLSADYARALKVRQLLLNATEAAAIAGARLPQSEIDRRESAAKAAFAANILELPFATIEPKIVSADDEILVEASYSMPTAFTNIAGIESIDLKVRTRARSVYSNGPVCLLPRKERAGDKLRLNGRGESDGNLCQYR